MAGNLTQNLALGKSLSPMITYLVAFIVDFISERMVFLQSVENNLILLKIKRKQALSTD